MKKAFILFCLVLFPLFSPVYSLAFDTFGIQPVAPNGVFSTFSTETVGQKQAAVEIGFEKSKEPNFYRFSLKGAYGLSESMEFTFNLPYVYHYESSLDGTEDFSFGFKHRFYDEGRYGPSLAYILNASTNNGRDEFSTKGRFGVGFLVSKRVGPFNGHFNAFYERAGTGKLEDEISFLGGVEFSAANNFKILAELLARKSHFSNEYDRLEPRFGYRLRTTEYIYTTLGAGLDLKRRSPEIRFLASVSFVTSPQKKEIRKIYEKEE